MKKLIFLCGLWCALASVCLASQREDQHLTPDEFRERQERFIIKHAELSPQEAEKFFPIYFELLDKKKQLNDEMENLMRMGNDPQNTESRYGELLERRIANRIESDQLEKEYLEKFKTVLSYKKIFLVQRAEMHFHRNLIKSINRRDGEFMPPPQQK